MRQFKCELKFNEPLMVTKQNIIIMDKGLFISVFKSTNIININNRTIEKNQQSTIIKTRTLKASAFL